MILLEPKGISGVQTPGWERSPKFGLSVVLERIMNAVGRPIPLSPCTSTSSARRTSTRRTTRGSSEDTGYREVAPRHGRRRRHLRPHPEGRRHDDVSARRAAYLSTQLTREKNEQAIAYGDSEQRATSDNLLLRSSQASDNLLLRSSQPTSGLSC